MKTAGLTVDSLANATGSPDYIAVREALVNQFIHQDYTDQTACARIIIRPHETLLVTAHPILVAA